MGQPDRPNGATTEVTGGNFGIAVDGASVRNAAMMANASNVSSDTQFSFVAGSDLTIANNNANLIAVGEHIIVDEGLRGVAVFGKNPKVFAGGLHLGGGWFGDDRNNADGQAQYGVIPYIGEGTFTNSSTQIPITIEGRTDKHLTIDEGASMNCIVSVSIMQWDPAGGVIDDTRICQFAFTAYKVADEAKTSTVHQVFDHGSMHAVTMHIDTTTNVDEHRISFSMGGSGHPHNNIKIAASLTYTQIKE